MTVRATEIVKQCPEKHGAVLELIIPPFPDSPILTGSVNLTLTGIKLPVPHGVTETKVIDLNVIRPQEIENCSVGTSNAEVTDEWQEPGDEWDWYPDDAGREESRWCDVHRDDRRTDEHTNERTYDTMPKDAEFRRSQREAFEAVLKALSVVKLDWSKQKLLGELRKHLNISESTYVELLDKVLSDPEVRSSKGETEMRGSLREALTMAGGGTEVVRKATYETDNETDTEGDEDYHKDDDPDGDDEDSYSEGSTSRPHRRDPHRRPSRPKGRTKKRPAAAMRRPGKTKGRVTSQDSVGSGSRTDMHPIGRDEVIGHGTMTGAVTGGELSQMKPPYDKDVFETYLLNGTLDELKEMSRHIKRRRQALINVMLEDDDPLSYPEDDLVQKILLREKNVRQEKALEEELNLLNKEGP